MASDLTSVEALPVAEAATAPEPAGRVWPHRGRFVLVYGALGCVLAAALAGVVVYAGRAVNPSPSWSTWRPHGGGLGAAKEIADHVAQGYHLPGGNQLVDVIAKAPSVSPAGNQTIPIHYIAVRGSKGAVDQVVQVSSSDSVMYSLCGLGSSCSIATGKASVQRGTLVRREILELALYTFKYLGGVKNVIAFMPPTPGSTPKYVVYLQRGDLGAQLKVPLARTLASKAPLPSALTTREVRTIDATTQSKLYSFSLSQAQQGDAILVLAPLPA